MNPPQDLEPTTENGEKQWKIYFFVFFVIVSALLGLVFKWEARPPALTFPDKLASIEIFTTDPAAQVELGVTVYPSSKFFESARYRPATAIVHLSITPSQSNLNPSWILMINTHVPQSSPVAKTIPVNFGEVTAPSRFSSTYAYGDLNTLEVYKTLQQQSSTNDTYFPGMAIASAVTIPDSVATETKGNLSAFLPRLGPPLNGVTSNVPLIVETSPSTGQPILATFYPTEKNPGLASNDPAQYMASMPGALPTVFHEPQDIKTVELLVGSAGYLQSSQATSMIPPDGQVRGFDLLWTSSGSLQPTVRTISIDAAESRSSFDFYSGIAFATAAAALIAAVQEPAPALPFAWLGRKLFKRSDKPPQVDAPAANPSSQPPRDDTV